MMRTNQAQTNVGRRDRSPVSLMFRLLMAALIAAIFAVGASYTLRTLNL
jgi:hypothetical protein